MDTDTQLSAREARQALRRQARHGIAMVTALFALVIVGILAAGMYNLASLQAQAVRNRTASARALLLAESAAAHAVMLARDTLKKKANSALLRGSDNATNTSDDGRLIGFGMSSGVQIPSSGYPTSEGRYWVQFRDDDAETDGDPFRDSNMRIIARCTAATPDSGYATIDVLISGIAQMPGFFTNGNFSLGGNNEITGACGSVHTNGNLAVGNPGPVVTGTATSAGTVTNGGNVEAADGTANPAQANQVPLDVPPLPYSQFCPSQADWILRSGGAVENHTVFPVVIGAVAGLSRTTSGSAVIWSMTGPVIGGVVCVEGNFSLSGNAGTALAPHALTLVTTGSVTVSGTPVLRPATTDSVLIVAGADVAIAGNPAGAYNYEGLIYAGSQCSLTGNAQVSGNMVCRNDAHPATAMNYASSNATSGNATLTYGCGGYFNQPRRILQWVQLVR